MGPRWSPTTKSARFSMSRTCSNALRGTVGSHKPAVEALVWHTHVRTRSGAAVATRRSSEVRITHTGQVLAGNSPRNRSPVKSSVKADEGGRSFLRSRSSVACEQPGATRRSTCSSASSCSVIIRVRRNPPTDWWALMTPTLRPQVISAITTRFRRGRHDPGPSPTAAWLPRHVRLLRAAAPLPAIWHPG